MKRKVHYRYKWQWVDLCMDGMMPKERLKGDRKKDYQRCTRHRLKREFEQDPLYKER